MHFWLKIGTNWACSWSWSSLIFVFHLLHTLSVTNILQPSWEKDNLGRVWVSWRCSSWNLLFNWNVFEELESFEEKKSACSLGSSWNCSVIPAWQHRPSWRMSKMVLVFPNERRGDGQGHVCSASKSMIQITYCCRFGVCQIRFVLIIIIRAEYNKEKCIRRDFEII